MRLILLTIICLCIADLSEASQSGPTASSVDTATFELWRDQDWDGLIATGRDALDHGIDFYYLRYRMGIAWYEKGNYHQAARHFQAAWRMNPDDGLLNEYLYYSYLFSGRSYESDWLKSSFPSTLENRLNTDGRRIKQAYFSWSYQPGAPSSTTSSFTAPTGMDGWQTISTGYHMLNSGLEHQVLSRMWLHHAVTHLRKDFFHYYNVEGASLQKPDDRIYLNQYYLRATLLPSPGFDIRFGFHFLHLMHYQNYMLSFNDLTFEVSNDVETRNIVGFISLNRRIPYITAGTTSYIGNINNAIQFQQDAYVSFFPFGNLNFYTNTTMSGQFEKLDDAQFVERQWRNGIVLQQMMGSRITSRFWVEAEAIFGRLQHFFAHDGSSVYNDTDAVIANYGVVLHTVISPQWHLRLKYLYSEKESSFTPATAGLQTSDNITYSTPSITLALIWKR